MKKLYQKLYFHKYFLIHLVTCNIHSLDPDLNSPDFFRRRLLLDGVTAHRITFGRDYAKPKLIQSYLQFLRQMKKHMGLCISRAASLARAFWQSGWNKNFFTPFTPAFCHFCGAATLMYTLYATHTDNKRGNLTGTRI